MRVVYDGRAETAKPPQPGADKNEPKVTAAKGGPSTNDHRVSLATMTNTGK
mgnify:CR=1 FL=1